MYITLEKRGLMHLELQQRRISVKKKGLLHYFCNVVYCKNVFKKKKGSNHLLKKLQ